MLSPKNEEELKGDKRMNENITLLLELTREKVCVCEHRELARQEFIFCFNTGKVMNKMVFILVLN